MRIFSRSAGRDLLPRQVLRGGHADTVVVRRILEARLVIGPEVAMLAARRGTAELDATLADACAVVGAAGASPERQRAVLAFWDVLTDGADSLAYRLKFNGLRRAYEPTIDALAEVMRGEGDAVAAYRHLAAAVAARDSELARRTAYELLQPTTEAFFAVIEEVAR